MKNKSLISLTCAALTLSAASAQAVTLTIESWREDAKIWNEVIIPAFNAKHPDTKVIFSPTPATEYNDTLQKKLNEGKAGDLITCRPFDGSLNLFSQGFLTDITEMDGMENFPNFAKAAWQTDSGAQMFCLPIASVIHGFFYNKDIFKELGLSEPKTNAEFIATLGKIKASGKYTPLSMGLKDKWEAATMGFQNIGPNFWEGEDGRLALIDGDEKLNDPKYVKVFEQLAKWGPFMGDGYQNRSYNDAIALFADKKAAVYPAGSWDIGTFSSKLNLGVFMPTVENADDECYISDHTDIGIGINAKSANKAAAETFLKWMTSGEFAALYTNALPGFFSLSNHFIDVEDPTANTMISWRDDCDSTIRNSYQILSRGEPNLELEIWETSIGVISGTMDPKIAADRLQKGMDAWYKPGN